MQEIPRNGPISLNKLACCVILFLPIPLQYGNGVFNIKALPKEVQFSCVCGILCEDVNNDGNIDLVMAGNNFEFKPQFSRLDSNFGSILLNNGDLEFEWQDYKESGFFIKGEVKHLLQFKDNDGRAYIIAAINNEKPKIFYFGFNTI